jgi:uncharacterized protein YdcH (DUF465 family)
MENMQTHDAEATLEQLQEQHRMADQRLRELDRHVWLSPDEQVELARLKKEKLRLKDEMRHLSTPHQS